MGKCVGLGMSTSSCGKQKDQCDHPCCCDVTGTRPSATHPTPVLLLGHFPVHSLEQATFISERYICKRVIAFLWGKARLWPTVLNSQGPHLGSPRKDRHRGPNMSVSRWVQQSKKLELPAV